MLLAGSPGGLQPKDPWLLGSQEAVAPKEGTCGHEASHILSVAAALWFPALSLNCLR